MAETAAAEKTSGPKRAPQQDRSRASFERMMISAERLLRERTNDDFTLNEVSKLAKVSIGSIYGRFSSKDDLLRTVQARVLERFAVDQSAAIERARSESSSLYEIIFNLVEHVAETLKEHAPLLRPLMLRATADPQLAKAGSGGFHMSMDLFASCVLEYRDEILHNDPEHAARAVFDIFYSAVGRSMGFGLPDHYRRDVMEWHRLKEDLGSMCAAFLMTDLKLIRSGANQSQE